jgi:hypothetical protein
LLLKLYSLSNTAAAPIPVPIHIDTTPNRLQVNISKMIEIRTEDYPLDRLSSAASVAICLQREISQIENATLKIPSSSTSQRMSQCNSTTIRIQFFSWNAKLLNAISSYESLNNHIIQL